MALLKTAFSLDRYIISPHKKDITGPVCDICQEVVDSEALVEGVAGEENGDGMVTRNASSETCKVLVRHHGAEELRTLDMGSRVWGPTDLAKYMQRMRWFVPQKDE